jgi:hypothetical protein
MTRNWLKCLLFLFLINSVQIFIRAQQVDIEKTRSPEGSLALVDTCDKSGFTQLLDEHFTVYLKIPFQVREVQGCITSEAGEWPEGVEVLFEIRARTGDPTVHRAQADARGRFKIPNLPEGTYCFKATVIGWQSVYGVVIVSKKADRKSRIEFEMPLAV